jgi:hypothetical protein
MAKYKLDPRLNVHREIAPPPESVFIGLGWDELPTSGKRHYRRYFPDELENVREVMSSATPFHTYEIKKG